MSLTDIIITPFQMLLAYNCSFQAVFLLLGQLASVVYAVERPTSAAATCLTFAVQYPELTLYPQNASYTIINEDYWSAEDWLGPACIFTPSSAALMSYAVQTLAGSSVPFAVRGAGGMPILGAANINSTGVLLATTNLTLLQISDDHSTVAVGAGNTWADVYNYLDPFGLTAVGGRLGIVGVPGCLLGGCMSFLSNEYGWGSASTVSYEAILANGTIVNATATNEYSDLFWALRGGGNNFAIVTRFEIKTLAIPIVTVGQVTYGGGIGRTMVQALHDYAHDGANDNRTFVLPNFSYIPAASPDISYSVDLFYKGNDTAPAAFVNFTQSTLTPTSSTFSARSIANWTVESDEGTDSVHGEIFRFYAVSMLADLDAMYTLHDIFFNHTMAVGVNISGFISTMAMNTVTESFITAGRGNDPSGDPMGIDSDQAPYLFTEMTVAWASADDNLVISDLQSAIQADVEDQLSDYLSSFVYLNNAGGDQPVFNGYNADNVARLKVIRDKYDSLQIYTNQLIGGFKLI